MKNIEYFINKEKEFKTSHPNGMELIYDEQCKEFVHESYPDGFLLKGMFEHFASSKPSQEMEIAIQSYNLTDVEVLILRSFLGNMSQYFRNDYFEIGEVPEVAKEMQKVLDSIIRKAPVHNGGVVYRFLNEYDKSVLKVGDIITIDHSLTTTTDDWNQDCNVYVVNPLSKELTSAHDLYKIINHGNENQVNFIKGTKFLVTAIKESNTGHKRFFLDEMITINSCEKIKNKLIL